MAALSEPTVSARALGRLPGATAAARLSCAQTYALRQILFLAAASLVCSIAFAEPSGGASGNELTERALAFEHGEGVPRDPLKAAALYCEAARLGHAEAQFNLGWMYANGRGVVRDDAVAALLFGMAAKQGEIHAENMLHFFGEPAAQLPECLRTKVAQVPKAAVPSASPERRRIVELVYTLAPEYHVSPELVLAVISAESGFNASARSLKNAQGLMQLIPDTALRFKVTDSYDPVQNIRGGLAYLRWLLAYFKGDVALVAAGYNAGEGVVNRYRGIPPYPETRRYVKSILSLFDKRHHPYDAEITEPSPLVVRRGAAIVF